MKTSQGIKDGDTIGDDRRNAFLKCIRLGQSGYFNPDRPQKTGCNILFVPSQFRACH